MKLLVIARVPLPDIHPMGKPVPVRASRRVENLIARGHLEYVGVAPHDADLEPLPIGTTAELLEWAGDDPARAHAVLERELASNAPRRVLCDRLASIVDPLGPVILDDDWLTYALVGA